jgi:hypothetical protein
MKTEEGNQQRDGSHWTKGRMPTTRRLGIPEELESQQKMKNDRVPEDSYLHRGW